MFDIWGFLLQTLTVSGVAVLLFALKAMFRDKLPPKWQFGIWSVLGLAILVPAGWGGRYVLVNWPMLVDWLKLQLGDYSFTRVLFPFPVFKVAPVTVFDWLFCLYGLGIAVSVIGYAVTYFRLHRVVRRGVPASDGRCVQIQTVAGRYCFGDCRAVTVAELPSAFVFGVFRPVLVLPAEEVDDKVILHELIHLKNRDTVWSIVICALRALHWCNPLVVYCARAALNDLEARCDQMVLELLEGEDRRDYGRILLSMVNDRYARTPGATCVNNGGSAIRQRIEAIARFKLYPAGMKLVSVCAGIILAAMTVVGVRATSLFETGSVTALDLASARTVYCTTAAGAFDTYAKAVLTGKDTLRVMCAPEEMQVELAAQFGDWEPVLPVDPVISSGYYIYNLTPVENGYEGLLVMQLSSPPSEKKMLLGSQSLRVFKEKGRWVVEELDAIQTVECAEIEAINWSCFELPALRYSATYEDLLIEVKYQLVYDVDNWIYTSGFFGGSSSFDLTVKPNAEFSQVAVSRSGTITHLGTQEQRDRITHIGLGMEPVLPGEQPPERTEIYRHQSSSSSSSDGSSWSNVSPEAGWGPVLRLLGGGSKFGADGYLQEVPEYYFADLYINRKYVTSLHLEPEEGGPR